jgi:hypothetical protein
LVASIVNQFGENTTAARDENNVERHARRRMLVVHLASSCPTPLCAHKRTPVPAAMPRTDSSKRKSITCIGARNGVGCIFAWWGQRKRRRAVPGRRATLSDQAMRDGLE